MPYFPFFQHLEHLFLQDHLPLTSCGLIQRNAGWHHRSETGTYYDSMPDVISYLSPIALTLKASDQEQAAKRSMSSLVEKGRAYLYELMMKQEGLFVPPRTYGAVVTALHGLPI
ncbi:hypothetical protein L198_01362 [Cryptococcus wingfieldii CBS 7118]|uniref:Uncharacterized protein n=1 Tax=Cryptococcus wingfieldii CBS 7118 TaxID=1295528 RepID=A0A1E3JZ53_9TREE|nr:hypothetical protein L198_01362 [Cryptococcus wingfieldii CBS 7118]ODO06130.1 hypothetical protein L198_01362 [Cryptococcus wingfieldii CBS 7118]